MRTQRPDPYNMLIDPEDPGQNTLRGRLRHLLISLAMLVGLGLILVIVGWIASVLFRLFMAAAVFVLVAVFGPDTVVGPSIWGPVAIGLFIVWLALVALPVIWAGSNGIACAMGAASALFPGLAVSARFVRLADWLVAVAWRAARPFGR